VKVTALVDPEGIVTVVGVNIPPAEEAGVTTVAFAIVPLGVTVNAVEATLEAPVVGPVKVKVAADAVKLIGVPAFVKLWLLVIEIDFVPTLFGV
jgi:hypothetical protein